jgi:putative peptide zinc metalloprotease protein
MSRFLQSLISGSRRVLLLRMRPDLRVRQHDYLGRRYWVVKDPLSLKYYRFEDEEFAILQMLDGSISLDEVQRKFEQRFAPQKIMLQELHHLIGMLHRSSLLISDAPGQGEQLLKRHRQQTRREWLGRLTNVLSIRLHGFDPDRLLNVLNRYLAWFFSWPCFFVCAAFGIMALLLVGTQFDTFSARLPTFQDFFASRNWFWLALMLGLTKVLHEFGHGLACKRFGGECHEMGVMFLVFTPCLYCNVSDSWMLPSKWQRAAIGAAGMYVELCLATASTFLWWFTEPGLLNYLCLNVIVVCSVSTLLFNANPLMRYDGYYILSDLLEIPNLRQKADVVLKRKLGAWLLGMPELADPFLPQRRQSLFAIYSVAAAIYRWLVTFAIFWFLYRLFEPQGLQVIGQAIACFGLAGLVVKPLWRAAKFFYSPGKVEGVKKYRTAVSAAAFAMLLAGAMFVPLPHRVQCTLYLKPRDASPVYVETAGLLQQIHAQPGDWVDQNQPIVSLANLDVQVAIERLKGERQRLESKLNSLRQRAFEDEGAAMEISEVEESLVSVAEQLAGRERDIQKLVVVAPVRGVVIPPALVPPGNQEGGKLRSWSGTPFESKNLLAFLPQACPVCQIGDPNRLEAILAIDEGDVEFLHAGQAVDVFLAQLPGQTFRSRIEQLSQIDMKIAPRNLSSKSGGDLVSRTDRTGLDRPLNTTYQANAFLDDQIGSLLIGATGRGKIYARPQTVAQRLWRYVSKTFHFDV